MYSIFISKIEYSYQLIKQEIENKINEDYKVVIIPWAFPAELDANTFENEYFKKGGRRYNKYVDPLKDLGIREENIFICNCYSDSTEKIREKLNESNILLIPGGNPEMLYSKVTQDKELLYDIKYYKGIIIGESAGAELQLKRYFITAKNNYYKYFAFYDGFGVLDDPFYMDVHTTNNKKYLDKLQSIASNKKKKVYAIYDDGAIVYNRENNDLKLYGNVKTFLPNNE